MIYLNNNTDTQIIFIPRETIDSGGKVVVKHYDEGVEDGIKIGEQRQKDKLLNVYITKNGEYQTENGYGLVTVDIDVEAPSVSLEKGHFTASENGEYAITPTEGFDGLESLNLTVDVQCPDCDDLTELKVTENGVYEGAFNRVDVNVDDTNGSYDDGYNQGYQDGQANCEGGGEGSCNLEDKWITPSMGEADGNGLIVAQPSDGFDGMSRVVIDPSTIYNEGVEQGRNEGGVDCPEQTYINPIIVSDGSGMVNGDEGVEVPHFVYGGNTQYEVQGITPSESTLLIKTSIDCFGIDYDNLSEPINVIGAENADWNETTFGLRIWGNSFNFKIGNWENSFPFSYGWHDIEMGYNAESCWISVDGEYHYENNMPYTDRTDRQIMIGAINSENGAFRPFYGSIGVTYIECTSGKIYLVPTGAGKMLAYYNDFNSPYTTLEGQGSYDVRRVYGDIKTFTWLGRQAAPTFTDLEVTENRVYSPSEYGVDYFRNVNVNVPQPSLTELKVTENGVYEGAYNKVNVNIPTIQEQIKDYYYCPLIVSDGGFGEAAKSWNENFVTFNNYNGDIEPSLYVPTLGNRNEFRTKNRVDVVQNLTIPSNNIGSLIFGDDVRVYVNADSQKTYTVLTELVLGEKMEYFNTSAAKFPALNKIYDYSLKSNFDINIANVKGGGTLYLKNEDHETEWRNNLPEDWTIIYI